MYVLTNVTLDIESNLTAWNESTKQTDDTAQSAGILKLVGRVVLGVILCCLCLLTTAGNAMVLHAVRTERALQSVSNMYIVSLALADLTVGIIVMPISTIYIFTREWLFGLAVCQFWIGVDYTASTASILNLFILSLDRYWSVTSPLRYLRKRTKRRAIVMIASVWLVSSLWLIPIIGWHHFEHHGVRTVSNNVCDTEYSTNTTFKVITGLFNFYVPLVVMYSLYTKIFFEIKKRSKMEVGQKNHGGNYKNEAKELVAPLLSTKTQSQEQSSQSSTDKTLCKTRYENRNDSLIQSSKSVLSKEFSVTPFHNETLVHSHLYANAKEVNVPSETATSEYNPKSYYSYDEVVIDSATERLHRYCFEEKLRKLSANETKNIDAQEMFLETCFGLAESDLSLGNITEPTQSTVRIMTPSRRDQRHVEHFKNCEVKTAHHDSAGSNSQIKSKACDKDTAKDTSVQNRNYIEAASSMKYQGESHDPKDNRPSMFISPYSRRKRPQSFPNSVRLNNKGNLGNSSNNSNNCSLVKSSPNLSSSLMRRIRQTYNRDGRSTNSLQKEIKAARQLGVIMSAFTLCFLPYFICFMVVAFCDSCVSTDLTMAVTWIGYVNSTLNPFLYPLCNAKFKRKLRKMFHIGSKDKRQSYYLGAMNRDSTFRR